MRWINCSIFVHNKIRMNYIIATAGSLDKIPSCFVSIKAISDRWISTKNCSGCGTIRTVPQNICWYLPKNMKRCDRT